MLHLVQGDVGQVRVVVHFLVAACEPRHGHRDDLLVTAGLVPHLQDAHWAYGQHGSGDHAALVGDEHIAGIAVIGQSVWDEPVVAGIAHRRIQKAIHDQGPGRLVHLVLDGLAADRDFHHDVDFPRRIPAHRNCLQTHPLSSWPQLGQSIKPRRGGIQYPPG